MATQRMCRQGASGGGWAFIGVLAVLTLIAAAGTATAAAKELRVGLQSFDDGTPGLDSYHTTNAQTQMLNSIHECLIEREPYSQPLKFHAGAGDELEDDASRR